MVICANNFYVLSLYTTQMVVSLSRMTHSALIGRYRENALLSEKDTKHELLKDFDGPFSIDVDLYPEFK
jgi:hypothetical protein